MRVRLLISAARLTLGIAILGICLVGEPRAEMRTVMAPTASSSTPDIYSWATPEPSTTPAEARLPTTVPTETAVPSGPPTWIEAPAIELSAPVVETGWKPIRLGDTEAMQWQVPDNAAGFHQGSAYPGQSGNTVISGHHNIAGEVFRRLVDLKIGDEIVLYVGQTPYHYRVTQKEIVREAGVSNQVRRENAKWIEPTDDERLTLVTCWPYTGNSHRLIVVARPVR